MTNQKRAGKFVIMVGDRFFAGPGTSSSEAYAAIYPNREVAECAMQSARMSWFTAAETDSAKVMPLA